MTAYEETEDWVPSVRTATVTLKISHTEPSLAFPPRGRCKTRWQPSRHHPRLPPGSPYAAHQGTAGSPLWAQGAVLDLPRIPQEMPAVYLKN